MRLKLISQYCSVSNEKASQSSSSSEGTGMSSGFRFSGISGFCASECSDLDRISGSLSGCSLVFDSGVFELFSLPDSEDIGSVGMLSDSGSQRS